MAFSRPGTAEHGWAGIVTLGMLTITTYGSWFYGFGVLIGPIGDDMGWSTTTLGLTYGSAMVLSGLGAFVGGRMLDRFGGTGPFLLHAVAGGSLLLAATWADDAARTEYDKPAGVFPQAIWTPDDGIGYPGTGNWWSPASSASCSQPRPKSSTPPPSC